MRVNKIEKTHTPSTITKTFPRLWSIEEGVVMVVTDLHGDWDAYQRHRDRFIDLQVKGQADYLVLTGDLIHRYDLRLTDQSLEIVLDVMALRAAFGETVIYLSGNHELPHIYGISLGKGKRVFTPQFEKALSESTRRHDIIRLFQSLPFFIRTQAGVTITHAGASPPLTNSKHAAMLYHWNHRNLLKWADVAMEKENLEFLRNGYASRHQLSYEVLAKGYLSVTGPEDPRYDDLVRGFIATTHATFDRILWPALFTRCEGDYGLGRYETILQKALLELSTDFYPQRILVAGHLDIQGGHQIVNRQHLRLASAHHAQPRDAGCYLLFDAARPVNNIKDLLLGGLGSVF